MKKSRIFATVVYFLFTFGIGVVFALTLPGYFASFTVPAEVIVDALQREDLTTAIVLTEPIGFYRTPALECKLEGGGGVVLYEAVMEVYDRNGAKATGSTSGQLTHGMLYKCYEGYMYGVSDRYDVFATEGNGTLLRVTTGDGETELPLLDYDSDGNGSKDGISTYTQSGFILLEIREHDVSSIEKLSFTDKTGATVFTVEAARELTFESAFFDCFGDIEAYNELVAQGSRQGITAAETAELNGRRNEYVTSVTDALEKTPGCAVTARSEEYRAATAAVSKRANGKAIPFVIVYFVIIYIIADFLLGTHFIIKFFKWFLFKVCKIPHKEKGRPSEEDPFGHDYFSMVTLRLDLTEVPEFNGSVAIKYTGGGEEIVFSLLKAEGYTATLRIKAGVYVNPFIDIDRAYGPVDLPDNLEVTGYQMERLIKIVKREV